MPFFNINTYLSSFAPAYLNLIKSSTTNPLNILSQIDLKVDLTNSPIFFWTGIITDIEISLL